MKKNKFLMKWNSRGIITALLCLMTFSAFAQTKTVKGTVIDSQNEPLIGAAVKVLGGTSGTITDFDGNFTLTNVPEKATLEFSYIGMKAQTVAVAGQTMLKIKMEDAKTALNEVVVVGYGVQKKVNVTGAVSSVSAKDLDSRPVQNVTQALQGVVPGLNISQTNAGGTLDSQMSINVRGVGTIGAGSSSSPLVLIDGVEGNINALNPSDIENISVLKDAASSSIYGARASFGVILITTKSGKSGATKVSYNGNLRYSNALQVPQMLDSYKFAQYWNEAAKNGGQGAPFSDDALTKISDYQKWQRGEIAGPFTGTEANTSNRWKMYDGAYANTNWFKEMYKDWTPANEHNVNVSGGTEKATYLVSGSLLDQKGLIKHGEDKFNRFSLNGKLSLKMTDWATLNYSNRWVRETYSRPTYMTGLFFHNIARRWPTNPVYDPNGHYMEGNEIQQMEDGGIRNSEKDYLYQQVQLVLEPIKNWFVHLDGSYNTTTNFVHAEKLPIYAYDTNNIIFSAAWEGGDAGQSNVSESAVKDNYWSVNLYTDYTKSISDHTFKVLAGTNIEEMRNRDLGGTKKDLITSLVPTINTATNATPSIYGGYGHWATVGFFGRFNYNFKEKYLFEANIRRDGTSRFIGDKTWGTFPSFSGGWNIAREDFFGSLADNISTLKLRGSWGSLGNMRTDNWYPFFLAMPVGTANGSWLVNGLKPNTSSAPGIVSSLMTWERIRSWNIGFDWNALNGRFTGAFDYFNRTTLDMIGPAPELSSILGTGVPAVNNADLESYGWELELNWRDRIQKFNYGVKVTLSDDQQKVTRYPNPTNNLSQWYPNRMNGEIWGYTTVGIAKTNQEIIDHLVTNKPSWGSNWAAGDIMYKDLNGDGAVNSGKNTLEDHGDLTVIGNSNPRLKYGITLDASYAGFDLRVFFQGVGKRDYVLGGPYFWGASGGMWQSAGFVEHWDFFRAEDNPLGGNVNSYFPRPLFGTDKNQQTQSKYLQDASYLRLKNVQLGYTIPQTLTKKAGIQSVRMYISGDNLMTFSNITGIFDPELLGGDWGPGKLYPLSRTLSVGLNVNF